MFWIHAHVAYTRSSSKPPSQMTRLRELDCCMSDLYRRKYSYKYFEGRHSKKTFTLGLIVRFFWRGWVDYHQSKFILRYRNWLSKYIQALKRKYMQKLKLWSISVQKNLFKRGPNLEAWAHIPTQNIPNTPEIYTSLALWMRCQPTVHRTVILTINSPVLIWHLQWRVARWE